jgi:hypothetical protein
MAGRFYITAIQLGIVKASLQQTIRLNRNKKAKEIEEIEKVVDDIEDDQFIGKIESPNDIIKIVHKKNSEEKEIRE